ncbi:MAG: class I SAM-dependent methyltransferase [Planctomycetota bacterium]
MSRALASLNRRYTIASLWYDATRWTYIRGRRRAVRELQLRPGARVLEVGCGTGANLRHLARAVGPEGTLVGLDYVRAMLRRAAPKAARLNADSRAKVHLVQADAAALPFACTTDDTQFDAVLFSYSLTMIPDWTRAIDEAIRVLRPGGRVASLDFSDARRWPPGVRHLLTRVWLKAHGVHVDRDFAGEFAARGASDNVREVSILGHYVRIVLGTKPQTTIPAQLS